MMWWGYGCDGFSWGGLLVGGLTMLLFWGGLIALAALVLKAFFRRQTDSTAVPRRTALDMLKERYARGEISRAEYLEMRRDLES